MAEGQAEFITRIDPVLEAGSTKPTISKELADKYPGKSVLEILHAMSEERAARALAAVTTDAPAPIVQSFDELNAHHTRGFGATDDVSELAGWPNFPVANEYR